MAIFKIYKQCLGKIPSKLRKEVADLYLSRYRKIILWGTDVNTVAESFDALYTDMSWVKVKRGLQVTEQEDLKHYLDMLVYAFTIDTLELTG